MSNPLVAMWRHLTGACLREAREDLESSSQWSRREMEKLLQQARLHRQLEERHLEQVRQRELAALDKLDQITKSLSNKDDE